MQHDFLYPVSFAPHTQTHNQLKRDLKSRVAERKRAVKNAEPQKSALCEHLMLFDHRINWEESTVLKMLIVIADG